MRKRLNKILSTFVAGVLCVSFVPLTAIASDEGIALTSEAAIVEVDEGEETPAPVETPQEPEAVETEETPDTPTVVEGTEEGTEPEINLAAELDEAEEADEPVVQEPTQTNTIAMIGSEEYATLQAAIDAASNGAKITLFKDSAQYLSISGKTLTIDLNGHTIAKSYTSNTSRGDAHVVSLTNGADVTFEGNGTITGAKVPGTSGSVGFNQDNGGWRTINAIDSNVTINGPTVKNYTLAATFNTSVVDKAYGGVVYVKNGGFTLQNGKITDSPKTSSGITYGKGVAVNGGSFTMTGGTITGMYFYNTATAKTYGYGGSVYVIGTSDDHATVTISGNSVIENTVAKTYNKATNGGNIWAQYCDMTISGNAQIRGGIAGTNGGNIYTSNSNLTISGNAKIANGSANAGANIACVGTSSNLTIEGGSITGGKAVNQGGGISASSGYVRISGGMIAENELTNTDSCNESDVSSNGGAGFYGMTLKELTMTGGSVERNKTTGCAGAGMFINRTDSIVLSGGTIKDNVTNGNGKGVAIKVYNGNSDITLGAVKITGNCSHDDEAGVMSVGGGLFVRTQTPSGSYKNITDIDLGSAEITDNKAGYGAGVAVMSNSITTSVNITDESRVIKNRATEPTNNLNAAGPNVTDELFFNYGSKLKLTVNDEAVENYDEFEMSEDSMKYIYHLAPSSDVSLNGSLKKSNATGYYCDRLSNVSKEECVEGIYYDPQNATGTSTHYVWNEEKSQSEPLTTENGLYVDINDAIKAAAEADSKTIHVCSTTELTADLNGAADQGVVFERCFDHRDCAMFAMKDSFVKLSNIAIDGTAKPSASSLIKVQGGELTFDAGVHIWNTHFSTDKAQGAVLYMNGATLNMNTGVKIEKNAAGTDSVAKGGAVYATRSTLNINGGEFNSNEVAGHGGAIALSNSHLVVNGGIFEGNEATDYGGAVYTDEKCEVEIHGTDTLFSNNKAYMGGAIFFRNEALGFGTTSLIDGGSFTKNEATRTEYYYSGGAIYNGVNCHLTVLNGIITNNRSDKIEKGCPVHKAAVSSCPSGSVEVYEFEGVLVYGNYGPSAQHGSGDIGVCTEATDMPPTSRPLVTVSDRVLGGGEANWTDRDGKPVDQSYYQGTYGGFALAAHPTEQTIKTAEEQAQVWFTGNVAHQNGSAIMNNGDLTFGGDKKNLRVSKVWKDKDAEGNLTASTETPDSVTVQLAKKYKDSGELVLIDDQTRHDNTRVLNSKNDWSGFWGDLGVADEYEWTVVEVSNHNGYKFEISEPSYSTEREIPVVDYTITNTWNDELINISAEKWWEDQNDLYKIRPESIELTLKTDNGAVDVDKSGTIDESEYIAVDKPITVKPNEDGDWHYDFTGLAKYTKKGEEIKYLIVETSVAGYVSNVEPVVTGQKPVLDENGEQTSDEEGNPIFENVYTWFEGDENLQDAAAQEWRGYNVTNSLDFADLEFTKTYEGQIYQDAAGNGNTTAVFRITGEFNGKSFCDNIISTNFTAAEKDRRIKIERLLVGATYTIEELQFDGSGYVASGNPKSITLSKENLVEDEEGNLVLKTGITFTNTGDNTESPNQGVINRYKFKAGDEFEADEMTWEQIGLKQNQAA